MRAIYLAVLIALGGGMASADEAVQEPGTALGQASARLLADGLAAYEAEDYARALTLLQGPAIAGEAEAQYRLGTIWTEARTGELRIGRGLDWYDRAYAQGHNKAGLAYGVTVIDSQLTGPAATRAEVILQELTECGMPAAMSALRFWAPQKSTQSRENAQNLLLTASLSGDPVAQYNLALLMHKNNHNIDALAWMLISSEQDHAEAIKLSRMARSEIAPFGHWHLIEDRAKTLSKMIVSKSRELCE